MDGGCVEREHFNESRSMFAVSGERRTRLRVALSSLKTLWRLLPIDAGRNGEERRNPHSVGLRNRWLRRSERRTSQHPRCLQGRSCSFHLPLIYFVWTLFLLLFLLPSLLLLLFSIFLFRALQRFRDIKNKNKSPLAHNSAILWHLWCLQGMHPLCVPSAVILLYC